MFRSVQSEGNEAAHISRAPGGGSVLGPRGELDMRARSLRGKSFLLQLTGGLPGRSVYWNTGFMLFMDPSYP